MSPQANAKISGPVALRAGALPPERRFRRGYVAPAAERATIARAHVTRPLLSAALALCDQAGLVLCAILAAWPALWHTWNIPAGLLAMLAACLVTGRQFRALECLAHEASHYNWNRRNRRANDVLAAVLAGSPTGVCLGVYRESHLRHHGRFGTRDDPDRVNYEMLQIEALDRSSAVSFALDSLARIAAYRHRWRQVSLGLGKLRAVPVIWAGLMMVLSAGLAWGRPSATLIGACVWLTGRYAALPVIRFLGESSEHYYTGQQTVFNATLSNLGFIQRVLIHPHGDGYHTIHHLWPGVPHHQVRRLHNRLLIGDPDGYARRLRYRTRFLSAPVAGMTASKAPRRYDA